tara:strand:- start:817 stop:1509 length:693 start_codon:yes stop_codon:yes gene_type:complete
MKNKILCIIPARGGSKGIKNKNLIKFKGKPLLYWTLKIAKQINFFDKIIVSTDSKKIQRYAKNNNISAPFLRPKLISKDDTPMKDVILHVLEYFKDNNYFPTTVVLLQPTSPFRTKSTIVKAHNIFIKKKLDSLFSVEKIKHTHHPSYVFHDKKELLKSKLKNLNNKKNRQALKEMFALDGGVIFITKSKIVKKSIIAGKIDYIEVFQPESFDIDSYDDLKLCEMINVKL